MCGIFGFISSEKKPVSQVLVGLKNLDYRGYDSWGVATVVDGKLVHQKDVGPVPENCELGSLLSTVGLSHTRWATHGGVTQKNAHPHVSPDGSFAVVQNGVVENYVELKQTLIADGVTFVSQTDTEVIVHLLAAQRALGADWLTAIRTVFTQITGRNTIGVITQAGEIWAVRQGSPLVVAQSDNTVFVSSDALSCAGWADQVAVVLNGQVIHCVSGQPVSVYSVITGEKEALVFEPLSMQVESADKEGYPHYLLKEIHETPLAIQQAARYETEQMQAVVQAIKQAKYVFTIGSGSAGVAAVQIAYYLRSKAGVAALPLIGAESGSWLPFMTKGTVVIAPSQSGETADVLQILEPAKEQGATIVTYVNMAGSMMTRMADHAFMAGAGPERSVMSTKVLVSQCAWGYYLAACVAGTAPEARTLLAQTADVLGHFLAGEQIHATLKSLVSDRLLKVQDLYLLGSESTYGMVLEGMIKSIEGAYVHAHAFPAGDLKHYAITLMQEGVEVLGLIDSVITKKRVDSALHEVSARGAGTITFAPAGVLDIQPTVELPECGSLTHLAGVVCLQLMAYYWCVALGHNVDKPRNIAKSVTVL